jgi:PAS domain S-box-containing protein
MTGKPTYKELEAGIQEPGSGNLEKDNQEAGIIRVLSESFVQLADRSPDAIYQFDIESGTFPFFNTRFLALFEIEEQHRKKSPNRLSTFSVLARIHPDDLEKVKAARSRSLEPGCTFGEVEYRHVAADGTTRWLHDRWSVIRDSRNQPISIEGFIRDNTEKKQIEDELERSRNNALIGSYILRKNRFRYVNPEFCRITGYREDELIGIPSLSIVHEDYREHLKKHAKLMLAGQRTEPYEFCIIAKNGDVKWIMETVTNVKCDGKHAVLGYFMEITGKKQIEKERREKEKLQGILEMAGAVGHELNSPLQVILTGIEKLSAQEADDRSAALLIELIKKNTQKIVVISRKIQHISKYKAKDYVQGKKIVDLDTASE